MSLLKPQAELLETVLHLPAGFQPAGIARGRGDTVYVGSRGTGAIYAVDPGTGQGHMVVAQQAQAVLGLACDLRTNWLYAAGGDAGNALVFDLHTGALLHDIQLTFDRAGLAMDVTLAAQAAWFTDGDRPVLYRLALTEQGELRTPILVEEVALGGAYRFVEGDLNASGIVATAHGIVIVHTASGVLYRVDEATGNATVIDLGGAHFKDSSGLALQGQTLYVVNFNNLVYAVDLDASFSAATVHRVVTSAYFDNPSSAVVAGDVLCVVNARIATDALPETAYWLTSISISDPFKKGI